LLVHAQDDARLGAELRQHRRGGDTGDIHGRVGAQQPLVSGHDGNLDAGPLRPVRLDHVTRPGQREAEHVESRTEVAHARRREDADGHRKRI
jgi:hypothetical protein